MKRTSLAALALFGTVSLVGALASACSNKTIDGQGAGCTKDSDCPSGNSLTCVPFTAGGGSCQIKCDPSKPTCPENETCGEIPNTLPAVCRVSTDGGSGGGSSSSTTTNGSTSTGG